MTETPLRHARWPACPAQRAARPGRFPQPSSPPPSYPAPGYLAVFNVRLQGGFLEPVHGRGGGEGGAVDAGPVFHLGGVGGAFAPGQGPCRGQGTGLEATPRLGGARAQTRAYSLPTLKENQARGQGSPSPWRWPEVNRRPRDPEFRFHSQRARAKKGSSEACRSLSSADDPLPTKSGASGWELTHGVHRQHPKTSQAQVYISTSTRQGRR